MNTYSLGSLPIELTYDSKNLYIKPIYINMDWLHNIYYNNPNIILALEYEASTYSGQRDPGNHYKKYIIRGSKKRWLLKYNQFTFNNVYTIKLIDINTILTAQWRSDFDDIQNVDYIYSTQLHKSPLYKTRLRATYYYDKDSYLFKHKQYINYNTYIYSNRIIFNINRYKQNNYHYSIHNYIT